LMEININIMKIVSIRRMTDSSQMLSVSLGILWAWPA